MALDRKVSSALFLAVGSLITFSILLFTAPSKAQQNGPPAEEPFSCTPDEEQVESFSGRNDITTPEFQITGAEWRIVLKGTATTSQTGDVSATTALNFDEGSAGFGSANVIVFPDFDPTDVNSSGIIDGPGSAALEIDANGASYEILVCQSGVSEKSNAENEISNVQKQDNKERSEKVIEGSFRKKPLVKTGGVSTSYIVYGSVVAGASLLALTLVVRRRP